MPKQNLNRIDHQRKLWDSKASTYDRLVDRYFAHTYEQILQNVARDARGSHNLLEAGTGTGILATLLSNVVPHITAIDISPEMIKVAKEKAAQQQLINIDFSVGDIGNLPFENNIFDTVVAANVLHLLPDPQAALGEMRRVLADNGKIIVPTFCHGANLRSNLLTLFLSLIGQKPANWWSPKNFKRFIKNGGFDITRNVYINGNIPLLYVSAIKQ